MKRTRIIYRIATGLIVFIMGVTSISYLLGVTHFTESTRSLGYPIYLMYILGTAKLLGLVTLMVPGFPRLKEWAYAGFTFNLLGATWSHMAVGQYSHVPLAVLWLVVLMTSYISFRKLGSQSSLFSRSVTVPKESKEAAGIGRPAWMRYIQ